MWQLYNKLKEENDLFDLDNNQIFFLALYLMNFKKLIHKTIIVLF